MAQQKKMVEAITSMDEDFAKCYTDVCKKAELVEYNVFCHTASHCCNWEGVTACKEVAVKALFTKSHGLYKNILNTACVTVGA